MDSGDEAVVSSGASSSESPALPPPEARHVETFSEMLRLAEYLRGQKRELGADELVDICAAAARVKFYDPGLFRDTLGPALESSFRSGLTAEERDKRFTVDSAVETLRALASLNAAGALPGVFTTAAKALRERSESITTEQKKVLREVFVGIDREGDVAFLKGLTACADTPPPQVRGSLKEGQTPDGLPMRPGARICESYLKTGHCRAGASCRWDHPEELRVRYNSEGYPMRPWAPACPQSLLVEVLHGHGNMRLSQDLQVASSRQA